jgi:phage protein U
MTWAQLGAIRFEPLDSPTSLQRTQETPFSEHPVIGGKPRLQRNGDGLQQWTIDIRLHPLLGNVRARLDALTAAQADINPLPFVLGSGRVVALVVITKIEETTYSTWADGESLEAFCTLTLREWNPAVSKAQSAGVKSAAKPVGVTAPSAIARDPNAPVTRVQPVLHGIPDEHLFVPPSSVVRWPWR